MQQRMLQLIAYLLNKIDKKIYSNDFLENLSNDLKSEGYSKNEISFALNWIEDSISSDSKSTTFRVLSVVESEVLQADAYGYLLTLLRNEILTSEEMELVIENAVNLALPNISINDLNEIISVLELSFEDKAKKKYPNFIAINQHEIN